MSRHDFRCALSGVSLLNAEVALFLVERRGDLWHPASLPLWGTYDGSGVLAEFQEGPNADVLLDGWIGELRSGNVHVDFEKMGLVERPLESLEMMLGVMACSQIGNCDAIRVGGNSAGFVLLSAHVAAHLMELLPNLRADVTLEALPDEVFEGGWGSRLYASLSKLELAVRCKFGISLSGLLALAQRTNDLKITLAPTAEGILESESEPARYLAEALVRFATDEVLSAALEDYAGQFGEEAAYD